MLSFFQRKRFFRFPIFTMMEREKRIYNQLKAQLALKGVKNKTLAHHLKISEQTVSKWCTNLSQPSIPELYSIAEYLKVNVIDLLVPMPVSK
jgi:transcriptional regulator with XRE-family HTH domain